MNIQKTKIIGRKWSKNKIKTKTFAIEVCKTATYLEQQISLEDKMEKEINIRKILASKRYTKRSLQLTPQKSSFHHVRV